MYWYKMEVSSCSGLKYSSGFVLQICDEVVAVLGLLQATEGHLGTRDVLLGVLEVLEL